MKKAFYILCGWFFVALAALGAVLPVLPTTPFLLVAAACFAKSSPRLYQWLLRSPVFGELIRHWQETRSMPLKAKVMALLMIVLVGGWSVYSAPILCVKGLIVALLIFPVIFILRIKVTEKQN